MGIILAKGHSYTYGTMPIMIFSPVYFFSGHTLVFKIGLDRTGHMSFLPRQDRTPKFAGQVLPDLTEGKRLVSGQSRF